MARTYALFLEAVPQYAQDRKLAIRAQHRVEIDPSQAYRGVGLGTETTRRADSHRILSGLALHGDSRTRALGGNDAIGHDRDMRQGGEAVAQRKPQAVLMRGDGAGDRQGITDCGGLVLLPDEGKL